MHAVLNFFLWLVAIASCEQSLSADVAAATATGAEIPMVPASHAGVEETAVSQTALAKQLETALDLASQRQKTIDAITKDLNAKIVAGDAKRVETEKKLGETEQKLSAALKEVTEKSKAFETLNSQCREVDTLRSSLRTSEQSIVEMSSKHVTEISSCNEARRTAENKLAEEKVRYVGCQKEWVSLQKTTEELRTAVASVGKEADKNVRELRSAKEKLVKAESELQLLNRESNELISRSQVFKKIRSFGLVVKALGVNLTRNIRGIIGDETSKKITDIFSEYWGIVRLHTTKSAAAARSLYMTTAHPLVMPVIDMAGSAISPWWKQGSQWVERRLDRTINQLTMIEPSVGPVIPKTLGDRLIFVAFMVGAATLSQSLVSKCLSWLAGTVTCGRKKNAGCAISTATTKKLNKKDCPTCGSGIGSAGGPHMGSKVESAAHRSQSPAAAPTIVKTNAVTKRA